MGVEPRVLSTLRRGYLRGITVASISLWGGALACDEKEICIELLTSLIPAYATRQALPGRTQHRAVRTASEAGPASLFHTLQASAAGPGAASCIVARRGGSSSSRQCTMTATDTSPNRGCRRERSRSS